MASSVAVSFVKQFSQTLFHLSQQQGSRFRPFVRNESQNSESSFFDRMGATAAILKTGRHSDTPLIEVEHTRRRVTLDDYEFATLLDKQDKIRMLIDPTSDYMKAASNALGRSTDDVIIAAALGNAYGGNNGSTTVALPATQFIASVGGGAITRLNVNTLRKIKKLFLKNQVDPSIQLHIAVDAEQKESLLNETEVTSSDFNVIRALVQGDVDSFMGFKFHDSERLSASGLYGADLNTGVVTLGTGNANAARQCIAWAEDGLLLSTGMELNGRIDERSDKSYATQVYASLSIGATRMEEVKVVGVLCKASA